jgi:hypothetical protein
VADFPVIGLCQLSSKHHLASSQGEEAMSERRSSWRAGESVLLPPPCRACPWHEAPPGAQDCRNFKKLLCRLEPAAILEQFFRAQGL